MEAFLRGALGRVQGATASGLAGKVRCCARVQGCSLQCTPVCQVRTRSLQTLVVGEHRVRVGAALASGGFGYGVRRALLLEPQKPGLTQRVVRCRGVRARRPRAVYLASDAVRTDIHYALKVRL